MLPLPMMCAASAGKDRLKNQRIFGDQPMSPRFPGETGRQRVAADAAGYLQRQNATYFPESLT